MVEVIGAVREAKKAVAAQFADWMQVGGVERGGLELAAAGPVGVDGGRTETMGSSTKMRSADRWTPPTY